MELVIDANILKGYFEETQIGSSPELTHSPQALFQRLGKGDTGYLDEGGQIQHEWRNVVDPEWFDKWYRDLLRQDGLSLIPVKPYPALRSSLGKLGFPNKGRDIWYVRTAKAVYEAFDSVVLVSEDLDFYNPKEKKGDHQRRLKILLAGNGPVVKHLRKEKIDVVCVANYLKKVEKGE